MVIASMTYSDQDLIPILKSLNRTTTVTEIALLSGIPYGTVKRRLKEMRRTGVIEVYGVGRRWGFTVKVINADE